jgi:hypothetical protein
MSEQDELYEASGQGVEAVRALAQSWDAAQRERAGHAVRVRIIDEMNSATRATSELQIEVAPWLWRLDTLRRAGLSPA